MNLSEYTYLLNHPQAITPANTDALDKVLAEFPYFQSARALRLKGLYNEDSFRYNYALKVTAAYTNDRSVLFDFITSNQFQSINREVFSTKKQEIEAVEVSEAEPIVSSEAKDVLIPDEILEISEETTTEIDNPIVEESSDLDNIQLSETINQAIVEEVVESESSITTDAVESEEIFEASEEIFVEQETDEPLEEHLDWDSIINPISENEIDEEEENSPITKLSDPATLSILESIREATVHYTVVEPHENIEVEESVDFEPNEEASISETIEEEEIAGEVASESENRLGIGKPLDFNPSEMHSFHQWLQLSTFKPIERAETTNNIEPISEEKSVESETASANSDDNLAEIESENRQKKIELIDKFIENNPKIPPVKKETPAPALSIEPSRAVDNSYLMTETLARVYLEQKKFDKAIQAYEILILKYPEKSSFFADRILDIKTLKNNNNN